MPIEAEPGAASPLPADEPAHEAASELTSPSAAEAGQAHGMPQVPLETEFPTDAATANGEASSVGSVASAAAQPLSGVLIAAAHASAEVRGPQAPPRTAKPGAVAEASKRASGTGSRSPENAQPRLEVGTPRAGAFARPRPTNALAGPSVPSRLVERATPITPQTGPAAASADSDQGFGLGNAVLFAAGLAGGVLLLWRWAGGAGPVRAEDPARGDPGGTLDAKAVVDGCAPALARAVAGSVAASTAGPPAPANAAPPAIRLDAVDDLALAA